MQTPKWGTFFSRALQLLKDNFWSHHPVLVQGLALAPALIASTSALNSIVLTLILTMVSLPAILFASLVGTKIPKWARVPSYVLVAAAFYPLAYLLAIQIYPAANVNLGVFLPLLVVSSFVYTKAEKQALYLQWPLALLDGLFGGLSFGLFSFVLGSLREIFGAGRWMAMPIPVMTQTMSGLQLPFAGFLIAGFVAAWIQRIRTRHLSGDLPLWESNLEWDGTEVLDPDHQDEQMQEIVQAVILKEEQPEIVNPLDAILEGYPEGLVEDLTRQESKEPIPEEPLPQEPEPAFEPEEEEPPQTVMEMVAEILASDPKEDFTLPEKSGEVESAVEQTVTEEETAND